MDIKPIRNKRDYKLALTRLEEIFDAAPGTPEGDELEVLGVLIDNYGNTYDPIGYPDPVEAIKFRMQQVGYNQSVG